MSMTVHISNNFALLADSELVTRALAGREDNFEELVRRYQRPIAAYIYRLIGDYEASLDLTQDVFVKIYSSLHRYRAEYKFSTWIYKIAHNAAVDHLRRNAVRQQALVAQSDGETYDLPIECQQLTPEQASERAERRAEIEALVLQLPDIYRELVVLRHAHDMSYDEIAEVTALPLGTVKNRLFRAREALRQMLVQRGITGMR
jgi:RNA polymerase sigma-70 factor (ECF subfamily)